jgi:hypothetical protein
MEMVRNGEDYTPKAFRSDHLFITPVEFDSERVCDLFLFLVNVRGGYKIALCDLF